MIICVDIDGTLTDFEGFVKKYGSRYFDKRRISVEYLPGYDIKDSFRIRKSCAKGNLSFDTERALTAYSNDFWKKYYVRYCLFPFRYGSAKTLRQMMRGNTVYLISSREHACEPTAIGLAVKALAVFQLKVHGIKYNKLIFAGNDEEKVGIIKSLHADIAIDDKPEIVAALEDSMRMVCFNTSYNANATFLGSVFRAKDWEAAEEYILK